MDGSNLLDYLEYIYAEAENLVWTETEEFDADIPEAVRDGETDSDSKGIAEDDYLEILLLSLIREYSSWTNGESNVINVQIDNLPTLYVMMNIDPDNYTIRSMAVLLGGKWHDMTELAYILDGSEPASVQEAEESALTILLQTGGTIFAALLDQDGAGEIIQEGDHVYLPSNGLEEIELPVN